MIKNILYGRNKINLQSGFAALLTIVIVSSAVLIMAYSASLLGLGELELGYTSQKGDEAFAIADGCMEETFRRLRLDSGYSGDSHTTKNGSCIISVGASGSDRIITITASTTDSYNKKIEAIIMLSADNIPVITVSSWEEKDN